MKAKRLKIRKKKKLKKRSKIKDERYQKRRVVFVSEETQRRDYISCVLKMEA